MRCQPALRRVLTKEQFPAFLATLDEIDPARQHISLVLSHSGGEIVETVFDNLLREAVAVVHGAVDAFADEGSPAHDEYMNTRNRGKTYVRCAASPMSATPCTVSHESDSGGIK